MRQQHLGRVQAVAAEAAFIALGEPHLAYRGGRLQLVHGVRAARPAQALHALGDGAARHQDHFFTAPAKLGDLRGPARDRRRVETAALVRHERGSDLHYDGFGFFQTHDFWSSRATAFMSDEAPSPLMAQTLNHGRFQRNCPSARRIRPSASSTASILLNTSQRGLRWSVASYSLSSAPMVRTSRAGCSVVRSTMCRSSRVLARCRRNWWPRPAPLEAPSISPGMSATTKLASPTRTTPSEGLRVVKG